MQCLLVVGMRREVTIDLEIQESCNEALDENCCASPQIHKMLDESYS